jgi:hypothetical protein|tara:strand:+ start:260 stop:502 length:243 start_codon:yes stop_codon:yes gene_type:complete
MNTNKQLNKGNTMKKAMVIREEEKTSVTQIIGGLMIGFAAIDFIASFAGVNLTPFLGSASRFSPIVFGLIGSALLNSNSK